MTSWAGVHQDVSARGYTSGLCKSLEGRRRYIREMMFQG